LPIEDVQSNRTQHQDFVVECPNVETRAELILSVLAKLKNFELSEPVREACPGQAM